MANQKISAFTNAAALSGPEQIAAVQSAANVNITPTQMKTFTSASPTFTGTQTMAGTVAGAWTATGAVTFSAAVTLSSTVTASGTTNITGTVVNMTKLPTSDPTTKGQLWNNLGIVTVSNG